ncbi:MAG: glutamate racemase [Candidatus Komeilibacteria bacterium RIFCSPLOWO2_01_FULL_53_11]|uniref:Glutamate racemase n=1 Tax=Candidatus Komeilibacteria bacterium RIFCSPLOWO2_01_FULL_53_11 TaxID=1798552 RepID=A0A1G2BSC7_9BACT|nr:MAG: glutamate racemase [Candidatus Komeilibacteria bacterium RIFCSPLOWO2_01_FULL_53_11]
MIGIFDSGLGGLTIFRAIEKRLPDYDYIYLGDNARAPYGDHSQETILKYTTQAVEYLFQQGCVLVLLACNTASAEALRKIQQEWLPKHYPDRNVLGVIRPLVEEAARISKKKRVGVLGTRSTINSHAYRRELQKQNVDITAIEQACRLLVPLIEEGFEGRAELRMILKKYIRPVKSYNVDTIILGCTHYGLIADDIKRYFGANVRVLDSGAVVADKFAEYLQRHPEYEPKLSKKGSRRFLTTELTEQVGPLVKKFFGKAEKVESVALTPSEISLSRG